MPAFYQSPLNITTILERIRDAIEGITPETEPAVLFHRWRGEGDVLNSEPPESKRAFQVRLKGIRKARKHSDSKKSAHRRQVEITVTYGPPVGPKVDDDNAGLFGLAASDSTQIEGRLMFGGLGGDIDGLETMQSESYDDGRISQADSVNRGVSSIKNIFFRILFDLEWTEDRV